MGKKLGIALATEGDQVLLHFSPKDKEPTRLPIGTSPTDVTPAHYSPAARLLFAADHVENGSWNRDQLRERAAELCAQMSAARTVADEALTQGWRHTFDQIPLSASEKAWRLAHHAATVGDLPLLVESIQGLPPTGYAHRAQLLRGYLEAVRHNPDVWQPALDSLVRAGAADAEAVAQAGVGKWRAALEGGSTLLPEAMRADWQRIVEQLQSGQGIDAPTVNAPAWAAAGLVSGGQRLDEHLPRLVNLEPALIDDLIDRGRLTRGADLDSVRGALRTYLCARLAPARLDDDEVRSVGHVAEMARRYYLLRDRASLSGLERTPRVRHYEGLLDVIDGGRPNPDALDSATIALLELPTKVLAQLSDGAVNSLPAEVAADASLWPLFAQQAITGRLVPDPARAAGDPLNVWIGLHRLIGLIWESKYTDAVDLGTLLVQQTASVERQQDEALSLTAFAHYQLGRVDDALRLLEDAVQGLYTENLLVNVSIVASQTRPEVGVRYLARLVKEAPTPDLQRAGLSRAIGVWDGSGIDFPPVLVPALRTVLSTSQPLADYIRFSDVAVRATPEIINSLPNPGGELAAPYRLVQARGRLKYDKKFLLSDLAKEYVAVYKLVGRPEWFNEQWSMWVSAARESVFTDFGDAAGSAEFIDAVLVNAPELFTDEERFVLAPQAGAHLAAAFARDNGATLSDAAWSKFFFNPINEFLRVRNAMESGLADYLASNFTITIGIAGINFLGVGRDEIAGTYNPLTERLRWDSANRFAILSHMDRILSDALNGPIERLDQIVEAMRRLGSTDPERRELTLDLTREVDDWRAELNKLKRNL